MFNTIDTNAIISKSKYICLFFFAFLKSTENFQYFESEDDPTGFFFSEITDSQNRGYLNASKEPCQNTY